MNERKKKDEKVGTTNRKKKDEKEIPAHNSYNLQVERKIFCK